MTLDSKRIQIKSIHDSRVNNFVNCWENPKNLMRLICVCRDTRELTHKTRFIFFTQELNASLIQYTVQNDQNKHFAGETAPPCGQDTRK